MAQESLGRRKRCGPTPKWPDEDLGNRDGRQRRWVPAGRNKRVEQLDREIGRLLAAGEVGQHDRGIHEDRLSGRNRVGQRIPALRHRFQVARSPVT